MATFYKISILSFLAFFYVTPLSIGQEINDSEPQRIDLSNPSFEQINSLSDIQGWFSCNFSNETSPDLQPGRFGCKLLAQQGKYYTGMVGRDNGTFESISQLLPTALKAGVCYQISMFLAKSSTYENLNHVTDKEINNNRPLKIVIWGTNSKIKSQCDIKPEDWLAESLPIHNDNWRKYTFYIQPPKDVFTLVISASHVVEQPYNGNLLIDNISPIVPVSCTDLHAIKGGGKSASLALQKVSEVISEYAPLMVFGKNKEKLASITEGGHHKGFDEILAYFEQISNYKLIIRLKESKSISKQRIAFLYSYIFKNTNLQAQRVEIKSYSPKDEAFFWTFENKELAISFDSM